MPDNRRAGSGWPFWLFASVAVLAAFLPLILQAVGTEPPDLGRAIRDALRRPSPYINQTVLTANAAETITHPTFAGSNNASLGLILSADCSNWYYNITTTASVPAGDVADGSGSGRAPVAFLVSQGGTLSVVADAACKITQEYYILRGLRP